MIRQRLYHRLQQLEGEAARLRRIREIREQSAGAARAVEKFRLFLRLRGTEQGPTESLAEASARALEIPYSELRGLLAAGIDPIYKYFTDNGVYEDKKSRRDVAQRLKGFDADVRL